MGGGMGKERTKKPRGGPPDRMVAQQTIRCGADPTGSSLFLRPDGRSSNNYFLDHNTTHHRPQQGGFSAIIVYYGTHAARTINLKNPYLIRFNQRGSPVGASSEMDPLETTVAMILVGLSDECCHRRRFLPTTVSMCNESCLILLLEN